MSDGSTPARRVRRALGKVKRRLNGASPAAASSDRLSELLQKVDAFTLPAPKPDQPQLRAAVAAGEAISTGLAWEWTQHELTPQTWKSVLQPGEVDLVLVEVAGGVNPLGAAFAEVRAWAQANDVPVFAWLTGDPGDPDAASDWIDGVRVYLDHDGPLAKWQARWPDAAVDVLLPAVQPQLHNPVKGGAAVRRERGAVVLYHGQTPAEAELAEFDASKYDVWAASPTAAAALESSPLKQSAVRGRQLPVANPVLSRYRALAELGPAQGSSWAAVQAGACQTPVIVEQSAAGRVPESLREHVIVAEDANAVRLDVVARVWQDELRDREGVRLARAVNAGHSFANRVDTLARAAGLEVSRPKRPVSAVVPTNRLHELDNVFANISRQAYQHDGGVELVLVLHGLDVKDADVEARAKDAGVESMQIIHADSSYPLGKCMNLGVDAAGGAYIAKMDDDNVYGTHYLTDLVAAFGYTEAGIVGKWAHYVWLRSTGAVVLRSPKAEHRYERLVQGGSIVLRADVARELRFGDHLPRGVDTDILNRAKEAGIKTYSADRFNYISVRGSDRHAHTWTITDAALMNRAGTLVFYGDPSEHVDV